MRALFCLLLVIFVSMNPPRGLAQEEAARAVSLAIDPIEDGVITRSRTENEKRLLALFERFYLPIQQEEIFRSLGLLFHQHYNRDTEQADYRKAVEYYQKAILVRNSYRDRMISVRCLLLECYDELKDQEHFDECLGDILYLDPEWILRDEYDEEFYRRYLPVTNGKGGEPFPESSLIYKQSRWGKMRRIRAQCREDYDRHWRPSAVQTAAMKWFREGGISRVKGWLDNARATGDTAMVKVLEEWIEQYVPTEKKAAAASGTEPR